MFHWEGRGMKKAGGELNGDEEREEVTEYRMKLKGGELFAITKNINILYSSSR